MPSKISLFLTSAELFNELCKAFPIHQQESSFEGWEEFNTDTLNIWFREEGQGCQIPIKTHQDSNGHCFVLDDNYQKLQDWTDAKCRTIWLNRAGEIPTKEAPIHDYELSRIGQLDNIQRIDQSPTLAQCKLWLDEWDLPANVRRHVTRVAWAAYALAVMMRDKGVEIDPILTHRGGLLHDLDKIETLKMVNSHGQVGASFIEAQGYPEIAEIVRGHILHTILDPNSDNRPWEVKLVYFCDKLTEGDRIVTLEERFTALGKRYPAYMEKMDKAKTHVWDLNDEICSILSLPDNEHLVSLLNTTYDKLSSY